MLDTKKDSICERNLLKTLRGYTDGRPQVVNNINGYLIEANNICIENRSTPLCGVPEIKMGNQPIDNGNYLFTENERDEFLQKEPTAAKYFKPWYGSQEFINRQPRYCLWLGNCSPNELRKMPDATLYHFGILESNVHMAWMRAVCGRLKSDYDYSIKIVYNNFPWPTPTETQKATIEKTAREILDVRALYPDSSLADLYDELTMPPELRGAHQNNDRAVMQAYGFSVKEMTESTCVAELMKMYQAMTE